MCVCACACVCCVCVLCVHACVCVCVCVYVCACVCVCVCVSALQAHLLGAAFPSQQVLNVHHNNVRESGIPSDLFDLEHLVTLVRSVTVDFLLPYHYTQHLHRCVHTLVTHRILSEPVHPWTSSPGHFGQVAVMQGVL